MEADRVVIPAPGAVAVERVTLPAPGPGDIVVRTRLTLVSSGSERTALRGDFATPSHWSRWIRYPFAPGYSAVADVVAAGPDVAGHAPGDRVVTRRPHQSHAVTDAARAYPVPPGVDDAAAVWFALAPIAQHAVRAAGLGLGDTAAVVGLGPLGQLVTRCAALAGAADVLAVGTAPARLAAAARGGATPVAARVEDAAGEVRDRTGGAGVDVAFDVTGSGPALAAAAGLVRDGGALVLVGDAPRPDETVLGGEVLRRSLRLLGVHDRGIVRAPAGAGHRWTFADHVALFLRWAGDGRLPAGDLVTRRQAAKDPTPAYAALDDPAEIGIVLDWGEAP